MQLLFQNRYKNYSVPVTERERDKKRVKLRFTTEGSYTYGSDTDTTEDTYIHTLHTETQTDDEEMV